MILRKFEAQISTFVKENYEIYHTSITWKLHKITTVLYCKRLYSKLLTHTTLFRVSETQVFVMVDRQYIPVYSDTRIGGFEVKKTRVRGRESEVHNNELSKWRKIVFITMERRSETTETKRNYYRDWGTTLYLYFETGSYCGTKLR